MIGKNCKKHLLSALFLAFLASTGCSSIQIPRTVFSKTKPRPHGDFESGFEGDVDLAEKLYYATQKAKSSNSIVLQVVGDSEPIRVLPLPTPPTAVRVSQLLKETGVHSKLKAVHATLFRHTPAIIGGIRMDIKIDDRSQVVRPECDYALKPGDRLRVSKNQATAFSQLFSETVGL